MCWKDDVDCAEAEIFGRVQLDWERQRVNETTVCVELIQELCVFVIVAQLVWYILMTNERSY